MKIFLTVVFLMAMVMPCFAEYGLTDEDLRMSRLEGLPLHFYEMKDCYFQGTAGVTVVRFDAASATAEQRQQATYPFNSAAGTFEVSSTDINDTGSVLITYLDSDWNRKTVTMTMKGQTLVRSTVSAIRILKAECIFSGAQDLTNQGVIYIFTGAATTGAPDDLSKVLLSIPVAHGVSKDAVYSTPANVQRGLLHKLWFSATASIVGEVYVNIIDRTETYPITKKYGPFFVNSPGSKELILDIPVGEKTDIFLTAKTGTVAHYFNVGMAVYYKLKSSY